MTLTFSLAFFLLLRRYPGSLLLVSVHSVLFVFEYVLYFCSPPCDSCVPAKFGEAIVIAVTIIPSLPDRVRFGFAVAHKFFLCLFLDRPTCCLSFHPTFFSSSFPLCSAFACFLPAYLIWSTLEPHHPNVSSTIPCHPASWSESFYRHSAHLSDWSTSYATAPRPVPAVQPVRLSFCSYPNQSWLNLYS